jgi:D-alanyl-D-alanine carboxypeptidase (penicillin-binding protein 5/6)
MKRTTEWTTPAAGNTATLTEPIMLPPLESTAQATSSGGFSGVLSARSAVLLDGGGNTLYSLAGDERSYPASTTKVLTALIAVENGNLSDNVRVGEEANLPKPGSSLAGLRYGEWLTLEQLLNALLIPSGNDAAYVIAAHIGRAISGDDQLGYEAAIGVFVQRMNSRAKELGAAHSHFANPDGYHDEEQYTTAADMALIARQAMTHPSLQQIVARTNYTLPDVQVMDTDGNQITQPRVLYSTNKLLDGASPYYLRQVNGIKTGRTTEAGYCLISSAAQGGRSVLAVVMGSGQESVWLDSAALLQWGLAQR